MRVTVSSIRQDALVASKEHSWYKHIPWPSSTFLIGFVDAATIRTQAPYYEGPDGTRLVVIPSHMSSPPSWSRDFGTRVNLTPMFRGVESADKPYAHVRAKFRDEDCLGYDTFLQSRGLSSSSPPGQVLALWAEEHARMIQGIVDAAVALATSMGILVDE
jgi:hypothetical protein